MAVTVRVSRRAVLRALLGAVMSACAAPVGRTSTEEMAQLPLVDNHSHLLPRRMRPDIGTTAPELLSAMDAAGIRQMVVAGFRPEVLELPQRHPGRFAAAYVYYNFRWRQNPAFADRIPERQRIKDGTTPREVEWIGGEFEEALNTGLYRALGEITTLARPVGLQAPGRPATLGPGSNIYFGVDFLTADHLRLAPQIGEYARTILAALTPATARKIAYENAVKAYGLG